MFVACRASLPGCEKAVEQITRQIQRWQQYLKRIEEAKPNVLYKIDIKSPWEPEEAKVETWIVYIRGLNFHSFRCEVVSAPRTPHGYRADKKKHWQSIKFYAIKRMTLAKIEDLPLQVSSAYKSHIFTDLLKGK